MIVWLAVGLLYVLVLTMLFYVNVLLDQVDDLQAQIDYLTRVHNWNVSELMHRSEQLQEVEVVKP